MPYSDEEFKKLEQTVNGLKAENLALETSVYYLAGLLESLLDKPKATEMKKFLAKTLPNRNLSPTQNILSSILDEIFQDDDDDELK